MAIEKEKTKKFAFLDDFEKEIDKIEGIGVSSAPPRYWYSTGNYVLNKIISGSFSKGIPQGRVTTLAGPAGAGKSFISANLLAAAQREGAHCLVIDSENALDDMFVSAIGVNVEENYTYRGVTTIPQVTKIVSTFLSKYKEQYGTDSDAPQVMILIDSLNMLMTETELDHFEKGVQKGDQGQKNKQLKQMLQTFVQAIKHLNVAIVCTAQVYKNQDILNGEGVWIVSDAVKYSASQIILIQKRKLKDDSKGAKAGDFSGVRMICEGYKTRFTKPFQKVEIEVPYETGMDPYSGFIEVAEKVGIVQRRGSRYLIEGEDELWFGKDIAEHADRIIAKFDEQASMFLDSDAEIDTTDGPSSKQLRKEKFESMTESAGAQ